MFWRIVQDPVQNLGYVNKVGAFWDKGLGQTSNKMVKYHKEQNIQPRLVTNIMGLLQLEVLSLSQ